MLKPSIETVDNRPYRGHLSIYSENTLKSFQLLPLFITPPPLHAQLTPFEFQAVEITRIRRYLRWNPSLEGNSSKKWLPISTIEITPQYSIVLSTYSWNPLVFLCGKRDYLESNTALMWRRERAHVRVWERERERSVLMEVASWVWISMMCTIPLNPFLIWNTFEL